MLLEKCNDCGISFLLQAGMKIVVLDSCIDFSTCITKKYIWWALQLFTYIHGLPTSVCRRRFPFSLFSSLLNVGLELRIIYVRIWAAGAVLKNRTFWFFYILSLLVMLSHRLSIDQNFDSLVVVRYFQSDKRIRDSVSRLNHFLLRKPLTNLHLKTHDDFPN